MLLPTDDNKKAGATKFLLVEDLTSLIYKKLKELLADKRVDRVWTVDSSLRFLLKGEKPGTVKLVQSVYEDIDTIVSFVKK